MTPTIFSPFSRPICVHKRRMKFANGIYTWFQTPEGLQPETKMTIEIWSQKLARTASFGLGICQVFLTISYFRYFFAYLKRRKKIQGQMEPL